MDIRRIRRLLRESSESEADADVETDAETGLGLAVPVRIMHPPRAAVLTMRDVRAVHAGCVSVVVVEPQEYTRTVTLTRRSALLRDFYPAAGRSTTTAGRSTTTTRMSSSRSSRSSSRNEHTGLAKGQGPACTGTGGDKWWLVSPALVAWLKARTRWFRASVGRDERCELNLGGRSATAASRPELKMS